MKPLSIPYFNRLVAIFFAITLFTACSDDDDDNGGGPDPEVQLTITSFIPTGARVKDTITITGTGFSTNKILNSVVFTNQKEAIVVSATQTELKAIVPNGVSTGVISVTVDGETVTSTNEFTASDDLPDPELVEVSPTSGYIGSTITIKAYNLGTYNDALQEVSFESLYVYFNDVEIEIQPEDVSRNSPQTGTPYFYFDVSVPEGLTAGETTTITLKRDGYTSSNSLTFTVLETPSVAAIYWPLRYEIIKGELGESGSTISTVYTNNDYISGLEVDAVNGIIYFFTGSEIKSVSTQGGTAATIFDGTADGLVVGAITVDATSQKIYFEVYDFNNWAFEKIYSINADGTELTELYYFDWNVDPDAGGVGNLKVIDNNLYWTEMYKNRVVKALADGSSDLTNPDVIYDESDGIAEPVSMAIDVANNKLYVFNNKYQNSNIVHGSLSGGTLTTLLTDSMDDPDADMYKASGQIRIDQEGYLYYINSAGGDYDHGVPTSIRRILIETGEVEELFAGDSVLGESLNSFALEID